MNIQEAKNIRLVDFLAGFGHEPVIQRGNSVWLSDTGCKPCVTVY